jgi:ribulose-phosphate 3-epimerase
MSKIIPAILERNLNTIQEKLISIAAFSKNVQIDVCDGKFVDNNTYIFDGKEELEAWDKLDYEFDFMVDDVEKHFAIAAEIGASKIVTHHREFDAGLLGRLLKIKMEKEIEWGIVFYGPYTKENFDKFDQYADYFQIMGIKNVGKQGQIFDRDTIEKIKTLREMTEKIIQIDGGMNDESVRACFLAGADNFVVGSYLDRALDKISTYRELNSIVK